MDPYVPSQNATWETRAPADLGFDPERLRDALAYAQSLKSTYGRDLRELYQKGEFDKPPWNVALGPVRNRGGRNGIVVKDGYIAAEWGDTSRADMASSVTKIFLNASVGLLLGDGVLADLDRPVAESLPGPLFSSAQNESVSWRMLLQLVSEWEGSIWDIPDQVDRNRRVIPAGAGHPTAREADEAAAGRVVAEPPATRAYRVKRRLRKLFGLPRAKDRKGAPRPLNAAGTHFEYNDIRVNCLSLALMHRARRGLPGLLKEGVMDPIGATGGWEWLGYDHAREDIDGRLIPGVAGGSHWGGGMYISSRDLARFGLLYARKGRWGADQLLPAGFVDQSFAPGPVNPTFGMLWWLNRDRRVYPTLPETGAFAYGAGSNILWVDPARDIVVAARWYHGPSTGYMLDRIYRAMRR